MAAAEIPAKKVQAMSTAGFRTLSVKMKSRSINTSTGAADVVFFDYITRRTSVGYLDWKVVGLSAGTLISFTYILCVAYDLIFPERAMFEAWYRLYPGFTWLTWGSFFLGLAESFLYGIYIGLVFAPLYNMFNKKFGKS